jgi:iron complex transport system substrate-binding protein
VKTNSSPLTIVSFILMGLIASGVLTGCGDKKSSASTATPQVSYNTPVTDMTGRSVMIPESSEIYKVAVLTPPQVLTAYVLGVQNKLCMVTDVVTKWDLLYRFDPDMKKVPAISSVESQANMDALVKSGANIVIGSEGDVAPVEKGTKLSTLRVANTQGMDSNSKIIDEVRFFGTVFGKEDFAESYVRYLDTVTSIVKNAVAGTPAEKRPRVLMAFNADHLATYGGDSFMNEWINAAGCVNVAAEIAGFPGKEGGLVAVTMEQIAAWNPDIIIIDNGTPDDLSMDRAWAGLNAMKNKNVYRLPSGVSSWASPSCEAAVMVPEWLAVTAYPDKLGSLNIKDQAKSFYSEILHFELSDRNVHNILYPLDQQI